MHTTNHALWGATIGRFVGHPLAGAVIASTPDIVTVPIFGYFQFKKKLPPDQAPKWLLTEYAVVHNWFFGSVISLMCFSISPVVGILSLGYLWHIFEDAFVHTKMATAFLWPIWKGKIQKYSVQEHKWVQYLEIFIIIFVNVALSLKGVGW